MCWSRWDPDSTPSSQGGSRRLRRGANTATRPAPTPRGGTIGAIGMELVEESRVQNVSPRHPRPLLRTVVLPVNQILETPTPSP